MGAYQHHLSSYTGLHNEGSEFGATLESIPLQICKGNSKKRAIRGVTNSVASSVCLYLPYQSRGGFTFPRTKTSRPPLETHHVLVLLGNSYFHMGSTRKVRFFYLVLSLSTCPISTTPEVRFDISPGRFYAYARHTLIF